MTAAPSRPYTCARQTRPPDPAAWGPVAEWPCRGLQILVRRFDSGPGLHSPVRTCVGRGPAHRLFERPFPAKPAMRSQLKIACILFLYCSPMRGWLIPTRFPIHPRRNGRSRGPQRRCCAGISGRSSIATCRGSLPRPSWSACGWPTGASPRDRQIHRMRRPANEHPRYACRPVVARRRSNFPFMVFWSEPPCR